MSTIERLLLTLYMAVCSCESLARYHESRGLSREIALLMTQADVHWP